MTDTKELSLLEKIDQIGVHPKKEHWSHQRFATPIAIIAGIVVGWLCWLILFSWWFREWRRAQDGINQADSSNLLLLLFLMLLFAAIGWLAIRYISNKHIDKTPKEVES